MADDASRAPSVPSPAAPAADPVPAGDVVASGDAVPGPVGDLVARLGRDQVFGPPTQSGGTTLVPVARVRGGGGGGSAGPGDPGGARNGIGAGLDARPVGAFAVRANGKVAWHPAVDVNRIVLGGQIALAAVLVAGLLRWRLRDRRA